MTMTDDDCKALFNIFFPQPKQRKYIIAYYEKELMQDNQLKELVTKFCDKYYNDCRVDIRIIDENTTKINDQYWSPDCMKVALKHNIPANILFDYYDYVIDNYDNKNAKQYSDILEYYNDLK